MTRPTAFQFKNMLMALSVAALVFMFAACGKNANAKRFKEAAMSLDKTTHTLTDEFDYWPECGIRVTGSHLASLISLTELQKMLPCPLYVSGPHSDSQWDLENEEEFGHYNPKAIQYLADIAGKVVADKDFVSASKPLIDKYLYRQMHIMMVLHDAIYDEERYDKDTRDYIFNDMVENKGYGDGADNLLYSLNLNDDSFVYANTGDRFLYFWARRWSDGTIEPFYQALSTVFKAYYPEYQYSFDKYQNEEWFYEEEYWDEEFEGDESFGTGYSCDLEDDSPISDGERIKEKDAVEKIRTAIADLDNTTNVMMNEFDYWPDCGLRITGSHLFSLISLKTLNKMLPCDLYLSGPHHNNRWELNSDNDFGHYNPEAIAYLNQLAKNVVADKKFVEKTKPLIDKYLKRQMYILMELYKGLNDKSICSNKQVVFDEIMSAKGNSYGTKKAKQLLDDMDYIDDGSYVYGNTGEMFLYFWARRSSDGTIGLFYEGLKTVYSAYYPED